MREPIGKRLRFEIFKRDGFRCVYCGANPTDRPLHVDHVDPVAGGGVTEPHNLVTACPDCNGGKSSVPLDKRRFETKVTEADRDHLEQLREYLEIQKGVAEAKNGIRDFMVRQWEELMGSAPRLLSARVGRMVSEFGVEAVLGAFEAVARSGVGGDTDRMKYLHGCLRRLREKATAPTEPTRVTPEARFLAAVEAAIGRALAEVEDAAGDVAKRSEVVRAASEAAGVDLEVYFAVKRLARMLSADTVYFCGFDLAFSPPGVRPITASLIAPASFSLVGWVWERIGPEISALDDDIATADHAGEPLDREARMEELFRLTRHYKLWLEKWGGE